MVEPQCLALRVPDNAGIPPTTWHVQILPSGARNWTASPPRTWLTYRAIYGQGYPWVEATAEEITEAKKWTND